MKDCTSASEGDISFRGRHQLQRETSASEGDISFRGRHQLQRETSASEGDISFRGRHQLQRETSASEGDISFRGRHSLPCGNMHGGWWRGMNDCALLLRAYLIVYIRWNCDESVVLGWDHLFAESASFGRRHESVYHINLR